MILTDNRNYLRRHNRPLLEQLVEREAQELEKTVIVELSKTAVPTLKINIDDKVQYIHSKYDPETEAERLIKQLRDIDQYEHVMFIGTGLGYHIKALLSEYPEMNFSIYEPNIDVLYEFLSHQNLTELPFKRLVKIFSFTNEEELRFDIGALNKFTYIFTLPLYEDLYAIQVKLIVEIIVDKLKDKRNELVTNFSFQKRWTINSIKNFPIILKTPNILRDIDKDAFKGKPAIIVAAGPSLNEEFDNLKYIKENGLAYIFSVGSAITSLIEQGIYPDAACTYDPLQGQELVTRKIKDKQILEIPLVFGSSVGFETLDNYPGHMLHMITNQDTISPRLLEGIEETDVVLDAPSIAIVTFQLLKKLGCNQIILVGQNLAFLNNTRYAQGIDYDFVNNELSEEEQKNLLTVKDVCGNDIKTNEDFNRMRWQFEMFIQMFPELEVINATKGGAQIEGAKYIPLSEVISKKWITKNNLTPYWFVAENRYDLTYTLNQINNIQSTRANLEQAFNNELKVLREINIAVNLNKTKELEKKFTRLDKGLKGVLHNPFYKSFIEPMVRVHYQRLTEEIHGVRFENDLIKKGRTIANMFTGFLMDCQEHINFVQPLLHELYEKVRELSNQIENQVKK